MKWNFTNSYDCNRELLLHPGFDQISTKINEVAANRGEKNFRQRKSHLFLFPLCEIWTVFNLFRAFSPKLGSIGSMKWASWRAPGETPECKSGIKFSNTSVTFPIYPKVLRYFLPDYAFVRARWTADEFANPPIPSETANFAIFIPGISRRYFRRWKIYVYILGLDILTARGNLKRKNLEHVEQTCAVWKFCLDIPSPFWSSRIIYMSRDRSSTVLQV